MTVNDQARAESEPLSPKQDALIALLLAGVNIAAAAIELRIADKTARRWLKLAAFQAAYRAAQERMFNEKLDALRDGVDTAISTLKRHMTSKETPASTQVRAAQIWLESAVELHKMSTLEQKIAELEDYIKQLGK